MSGPFTGYRMVGYWENTKFYVCHIGTVYNDARNQNVKNGWNVFAQGLNKKSKLVGFQPHKSAPIDINRENTKIFGLITSTGRLHQILADKGGNSLFTIAKVTHVKSGKFDVLASLSSSAPEVSLCCDPSILKRT